jgi:hypothetical protein
MPLGAPPPRDDKGQQNNFMGGSSDTMAQSILDLANAIHRTPHPLPDNLRRGWTLVQRPADGEDDEG